MTTLPLLALLFTAVEPGAAAEPPPAEPVRLLILELAHGDDVSAAEARAIAAALAEEARGPAELQVLTGTEVRRMVELETERMVVGCVDESCMAEIAGALGARYVLSGQLSRLSSLLVLQLTLFDAERLRAIVRTSVRADDARGLLEAVPEGMAAVNEGLGAAPSTPAAQPAARETSPPFPFLATGLLGAGAVAGTASVIGGLYLNGVLRNPQSSAVSKERALGLGRWSVIGGGVTASALLVAGGVLLLLPRDE